MPELPEVARISMSLNERLAGKTLLEIKIHSGRYQRHGNPSGMKDFEADLPMKLSSVKFYGKMILFQFEGKETRWIKNTLGMSGGWRSERVKHSHVELVFEDQSVFFTDPRNFGTISFISDESSIKRKISSIGPNHLTEKISTDLLIERLMISAEAEICAALMNQSLIGGVGNYIKAEVLYRSKISPKRLVKDLKREEFEKLNESLFEVIRSSFINGGSTIHSYFGIDGEKGEFPFYFKVYGRKICDAGFNVITETTSDGRTTHWVPEIQK